MDLEIKTEKKYAETNLSRKTKQNMAWLESQGFSRSSAILEGDWVGYCVETSVGQFRFDLYKYGDNCTALNITNLSQFSENSLIRGFEKKAAETRDLIYGLFGGSVDSKRLKSVVKSVEEIVEKIKTKLPKGLEFVLGGDFGDVIFKIKTNAEDDKELLETLREYLDFDITNSIQLNLAIYSNRDSAQKNYESIWEAINKLEEL